MPGTSFSTARYFMGSIELNKIQLRHLLDLALIRARHENEIEWDELDHRFSIAGFGEVLAEYLEFAEVLFGQPTPKLRQAPRKGALAELRRTESRDSFQFQIERLQAERDTLQTHLSRMMEDRDHFQSEAARLVAEVARAAAERDEQAAAFIRIQASRSWRFTKPFRTLVATSRRWLRRG